MLQIGHQTIHFERLPSTNAYAVELLSTDRPAEGTTITTDNQYSGKGQMTNIWESEPYKNIALSTILYPRWLKVNRQWALSEAVSLAVFHTIDAYTPGRVYIKWPNDIYIDDQKVAGILIQNQLQSDVIATAVAGIGINVNQEVFVSDAPNPTSLFLQTRSHVDLADVQKQLCENLTQQYHALRLGALDSIARQYREQLYRLDEVSGFSLPNGERVIGTIKGVSEHGLLRLQINDREAQFALKEIKMTL